MSDYLSRDPDRINGNQRARRARMRRLDYMPGKDALAVIEIKRAQYRPGSWQATNSAVLDAIVLEWADATGINYREVSRPVTSVRRPELIDAYTRANDFGARLPTSCGARTQAGTPCRSRPLPGKRRCKWHGGASTGPKTSEGRTKALANLTQFRPRRSN
jgi:hypothetical protein